MLLKKWGTALFAAAMTLGALPMAQAQELPCGTDLMVQRALADQPELRENLRRLEAETRDAEQARRQGRVASTDTLRIIPVVVHIFHNFGSENLTDTQIEEAIALLNDRYNGRNPDTAQVVPEFKSRIGNARFEFRLARLDPQGNCTNGITRWVDAAITNAGGENMKAVVSWNTRRYLNVWVARNAVSGSTPVNGYAYYPGTAPNPSREGVVMRAEVMGRRPNGTIATTLPHEIGHYFNLAHTWGNSNSTGQASNCNIDDGVDDTPNTSGVVGFGCPTNYAPCGTNSNVQNFMEYASCRFMFTAGQCARMRIASQSSLGARNNLWTAENLQATGVLLAPRPCPPQVAVSIPATVVCPGQALALGANLVAGGQDSTQLRWLLPGSSPDTAIGLRATARYTQPGVYSIRLIASNRQGADTLFFRDTIRVLSGQPGYQPGQAEDFENPTWPQLNGDSTQLWLREQPAGTPGWQRSGLVGFASPTALRVQPILHQAGSVVAITTPAYNLATIAPTAVLRYKYAGARRALGDVDVLRLFVSPACNQPFRLRTTRSGAAGGPTAVYTQQSLFTGTYRPTASDWRTEVISLNGLQSNAFVRFRFELTAGGGNALFIDSLVVVDTASVTALSAERVPLLSVAPNPAQGYTSVVLSDPARASYTLSDATGRLVQQGAMSAGRATLSLRALSPGLYMLQVVQGSRRWQERLLVQPVH